MWLEMTTFYAKVDTMILVDDSGNARVMKKCVVCFNVALFMYLKMMLTITIVL
jgi:hypothetical protein